MHCTVPKVLPQAAARFAYRVKGSVVGTPKDTQPFTGGHDERAHKTEIIVAYRPSWFETAVAASQEKKKKRASTVNVNTFLNAMEHQLPYLCGTATPMQLRCFQFQNSISQAEWL